MFADVHTQFFTTAKCFCETKLCRSVDLTSKFLVAFLTGNSVFLLGGVIGGSVFVCNLADVDYNESYIWFIPLLYDTTWHI